MATKVNIKPKIIRMWVIVLAVLSLAAAGGIWWQQQILDDSLKQPAISTKQEQITLPPTFVRAETNLAFVGDIFLGRGVDREARKTESHAQYPFANLDQFDLSQYQTVVGNLECASVNDNVNYQQQFSLLLFNCPTSYLSELANHFDIVSLANNHSGDQDGQSGLEATRDNLDDAGLAYFGNYEPGVLDDICKLIPVEITLHYSDDSTETDQIAVQFCGYHTVFRRANQTEIDAIVPGSNLPTFVMPHSGAEYRAEPIVGKVEEFRAMIDVGADAVIGAHPHWVQTTEVHSDKLIVYSLGNFVFDQPTGETSLGALLSAQLQLTDESYLDSLREIADSCEQIADCRQLDDLQKPFLDLSYGVEAVDIVDFRPQRGATTTQQKVVERMDLPDGFIERSDAASSL